MARTRLWLVVIAGWTFAGCGHDNVTAPSTGYAGAWSGTTSQNQPIAFTVSADQRVTSVTVGWSFNGCAGTGTSSSNPFPIATPQPPGPPPWDNPGFVSGGQPGDKSVWAVTGAFTSSQTATGTAEFVEFPGCGNSLATWNATRH
jgi:hypothetical protein